MTSNQNGGWYRAENNHPLSFDTEGNLTDQVTGEKGYMKLPDVTVTANPDDAAVWNKSQWDKQFENTTTEKPKWYEGYGDPHRNSAFHPADALEFLNVMTAGGMNNLSPTQWTRRVYDAGKLAKGDMSWSDYTKSWINGNNGVVTDEFAKEHPYWSTGFNFVGDAVGLAGIANAGKIADFGTKFAANPKWFGRAAIDVVTNPIGTYKAVKNGKYIYDYSSLRRNIESAYKKMEEGIDFTNSEYEALTGWRPPGEMMHIEPSKKFDFGTTGYYTYDGIHFPLTKNRLSNIRVSDSSLLHTGAHEQAHAANSWFNTVFETPRLGTRVEKIAGFIPNKYYIPNKNHPISNKYYWKFMFSPTSHGRFPEETWANYLGAKATGKSKPGYMFDNFARELILPPKGFIKDYKTYLSSTYRNRKIEL